MNSKESHSANASSLARGVLSGGAQVIAVRTVAGVLTILVHALLARLLTPAQLGTYFLALTVATACATLVQFGMPQTLTRTIARALAIGDEGSVRPRIVAAFTVVAGVGLPVALLLWSALAFGAASSLFNAVELTALAQLVAVWALLLAFQSTLSDAFRGFRDFALASMAGGLIHGPLTLVVAATVLGGALLADLEMSLRGVVAAFVGAVCINLSILGVVFLRRFVCLPSGAPINLGHLTRALHDGAPLAVNSFALYMGTSAALWVLGVFEPESAVAEYGVALRLVLLASLASKLSASVLSPFMAKLQSTGDIAKLQGVVTGAASTVGGGTIVMLVVLAVFGESVLSWIYTSAYSAAWPILLILVLGEIVRAWFGPAMLLLIMSDRARQVARVTGAVTTMVVLMSVVLVHLVGAVGVAAAATAGVVMQSVTFWYIARRDLGVATQVKPRWLVELIGDPARLRRVFSPH